MDAFVLATLSKANIRKEQDCPAVEHGTIGTAEVQKEHGQNLSQKAHCSPKARRVKESCYEVSKLAAS